MMKEMVYKAEFGKYEILYTGVYKGYEFYILNLGIHPTAYIGVEKDHFLYGKEYYDDIDIDCHGGLTYSGRLPNITKGKSSKWYIGWDYAHYGDYMGYYDSSCRIDSKKWSTSEIFEEVKNVIEQIIKGETHD